MSDGLLDIQIPVRSFIGSLRSLLLYLKKKLRKSNVEQIGRKQSKPTNNYTEQSFSERIQS